MSAVQQFRLKWNNHQPNFISVFKNFLQNKSLVDVTLSAEGKQMYAHKVVLSACSVYFQALFAENPSNHPIVILKDVNFADLEVLVDFIYCGQVNVSEEQLPQLLETAKTLKIKGLIEMPETSLIRRPQSSDDELFPCTEDETPTPTQQPSPPPPRKVTRRRGSSNEQSNGTGELCPKLGGVAAATAGSTAGASRCAKIEHADVSQQTEEQANQEQLMMESLNQGDWNLYANAFASGGNIQDGASNGTPNYTSGCSNSMGGGAGSFMACNSNLASTSGVFPMACDGGGNTYEAVSNNANTQATPRKRRRSINPQAEPKFIAALEAVRFGNIGFCKAARIFGVNNRTLWLEYNRRGYPNHRPSIKNRIKRESTTPKPDVKQDMSLMANQEEPMHVVSDQEISLMCQTDSLPVGYMNARNANFALQAMPQNNQPLNLHGLNYNPNPMQ